ncbi:ArnT family glycosyltransferase [Gimesia fumaroli]|uniref:Glycosyltransferase RgtA/B/C/D-like domain-containing protein n=1 Tax=Gimesia fumaroli TaxID=2527976 RepID=A0A518IDS5_9PLAN|nr:glycosyltransferase family 39 protein [Gimesia fumaroli]QDV51251.1 hypothetical protein Enr17x_33060 [Gimesia fumaroli]
MNSGAKWLLGGLLLLSLSLNLWNNDFPVGYHGDEPKKVRFTLNYEQDFHIPILMLQLARLGNLVFGFEDERVVLIGRWVSAFSGVLIVFFSFLFAKRTMNERWAFLVTAGVAVSPILVVHAHYMKEDMLFTACAMAALWFILKFIENPNWKTAIPLGITTGLAWSAHYKSALLVVIAVLIPLLISVPKKLSYYSFLIAAGFLGIYVFLNVNYPILEAPEIFFEGVRHEGNHAATGHSISVSPFDQWFSFHLFNSVIPGLTLSVTLLAVTGMIVLLFCWKETQDVDRLFLLFVVFYYLIPEISPSKPPPGYSRYILQIVPALIYFSVRGIHLLSSHFSSNYVRKGLLLLLSISLSLSFWDTLQLDYYMNWKRDTRQQAAEWLSQAGGKSFYEQYAAAKNDVRSIGDFTPEELRNQGYDFVVASDFRYERYYRGAQTSGQDEYIYNRHRQYEEWFRYPFVEIRPTYRSFAFSNPTVRIIDLRPVQKLTESN